MTRHIAGRAVNLGRILAGERAAAVAAITAVGVDDNLASGQSAVALRTADNKAAGRIDVENLVDLSRYCGGITRLISSSIIDFAQRRVFDVGECWVEMTTAFIPTGRPSA